MPQTVLTLISELQPDLADAARTLVEELRTSVETQGRATIAARGGSGVGDPFEPLTSEMEGLHFAAIMVFDDERFDPMLTVELNFDGPADAFLPKLQSETLLPTMRAILRCCKPPEGPNLSLYKAATGNGEMTDYLRTLIIRPAVAHQGNRGLERERIIREAKLYDAVQVALGERACRNAPDAVALHAALRDAVAAQHAWLDTAPPERIPLSERLADIGRLLLFAILVLFAFASPGFLVWLLSPELALLIECLIFPVTLAGLLGYAAYLKLNVTPVAARASQLPPASFAPTPALACLLAGLVLAGLVVLLSALPLGLWGPLLRAGLAAVIVVVAALAIALHGLETTDRVHEKPQIDPERLREIMELEDHIAQNHMGSVVHVKPGALRAVLIRLGLKGLGLLLRVKATNGYLAQMRTIHFAHWALLDNGSRLLFFSNFDSSWESYLDDFIEKAHQGLTLAWSNCLGFPRTKFLVNEGATHGPLFKTWARHSMARGLFWVSAYPRLSVNQIERNCAIARGLHARALSPQAAETWAALL